MSFTFIRDSAWTKKFHHFIHGIHHEYPNDAKRLLMPLGASIPLALIFFLIFRILFPDVIFYSFFAGFTLGYVYYDMMHYATHNAKFNNQFFRRLKRHHNLHHFKDETNGFGISNMFWDKIFKTRFKELEKKQ